MLSLMTLLILVNSVSAQRRRHMGIGGTIAGVVVAICVLLLLLCVCVVCFRRIRARRAYTTNTDQSRVGMNPPFGGPWGWSNKDANRGNMYPQAQQPFDPNPNVTIPPPVYGHNAGVQGKV